MKRFFTGLLVCTTLICSGCGSASQATNTTHIYTAADVATHATATDCWTVISGGVYNVTSYVAKHPGGTRILESCGKDATDLFNGKGVLAHLHSAVARALLSSLQIGKIE